MGEGGGGGQAEPVILERRLNPSLNLLHGFNGLSCFQVACNRSASVV